MRTGADNRLPPPPRDNAGIVALVTVIVILALGSLAVWVVS